MADSVTQPGTNPNPGNSPSVSAVEVEPATLAEDPVHQDVVTRAISLPEGDEPGPSPDDLPELEERDPAPTPAVIPNDTPENSRPKGTLALLAERFLK